VNTFSVQACDAPISVPTWHGLAVSRMACLRCSQASCALRVRHSLARGARGRWPTQRIYRDTMQCTRPVYINDTQVCDYTRTIFADCIGFTYRVQNV